MSTAAPPPARPPARPHHGLRLRELIETFATAFILALVFRAYVVEAFVIPTGSMAPTLMGEHSTLRCPDCGWSFAVGWKGASSGAGLALPHVVDCPNCRFQLRPGGQQLAGMGPHFQPEAARRGDRILVLKMPFDLAGRFQPQRWDVVVFKNPSDPKVNYIKRLVGLPGESIQIVDGDIWYKPDHDPATPWQIAHKPPAVQDTLYQVVYDNDYRPTRQPSRDDPQPQWQADGAGRGWQGLDGRVFTFTPAPQEPGGVLRLAGHWASDYLGYNGRDRDFLAASEDRPPMGLVLVSDLQLQAVVTLREPASQASFDLSRRQVGVRAVLRGDGTVQLRRFDRANPAAEQVVADGKVDGLKPDAPALVQFRFVDWRADLRINGQPALPAFDVPLDATQFQDLVKTSDASPVRPLIQVAAQGGPVELRHVRVDRDVFYRNAFLYHADPYTRRGADAGSPPGHGCAGNPIQLFRATRPEQSSADDQFFCLGDNSAMSQDGRLWMGMDPALPLGETNPRNLDLEARMADTAGRTYQLGTVPRDYLLGRAFFVYWPWGRPLFSTVLPIVPDVGRMRFIE